MSKRLTILLAVLAGMVAVALLYFIDPARVNLLPQCPLHAATGLYCPGCGSTRALHQLLHGRFAAAFGLNPLMVSCLPLVGYLVARRGQVALRAEWIGVLAVTLVVFGVLRNLPWFPFTVLAP